MFSIKRNQVIITALVVMIAVAGYLSFVGNNPDAMEAGGPNLAAGIPLDDLGNVLISDSNLAAMYNGFDIWGLGNPAIYDVFMADADRFADENFGEAVFVNAMSESSFFVQAKLDREQSFSKQRDILRDLINATGLDRDERNRFADEMLNIQRRIEWETSAESIIESRGFGNTFVRIGDETVDVVVSKQNLTDQEVAIIMDIVQRKTGHAPDKIRISTIR